MPGFSNTATPRGRWLPSKRCCWESRDLGGERLNLQSPCRPYRCLPQGSLLPTTSERPPRRLSAVWSTDFGRGTPWFACAMASTMRVAPSTDGPGLERYARECFGRDRAQREEPMCWILTESTFARSVSPGALPSSALAMPSRPNVTASIPISPTASILWLRVRSFVVTSSYRSVGLRTPARAVSGASSRR